MSRYPEIQIQLTTSICLQPAIFFLCFIQDIVERLWLAEASWTYCMTLRNELKNGKGFVYHHTTTLNSQMPKAKTQKLVFSCCYLPKAFCRFRENWIIPNHPKLDFYWLLQEKPVDKRPAHFGFGFWWPVYPAALWRSSVWEIMLWKLGKVLITLSGTWEIFGWSHILWRSFLWEVQ